MTKILACSFCGLTQQQVQKLVIGPRVNICDNCIRMCDDILVAVRLQPFTSKNGEIEHEHRTHILVAGIRGTTQSAKNAVLYLEEKLVSENLDYFIHFKEVEQNCPQDAKYDNERIVDPTAS